MRCWLNIPIALLYVAFTCGAQEAIHLDLWHAEHGGDEQHDESTCPFADAVLLAGTCLTGPADALPAAPELSAMLLPGEPSPPHASSERLPVFPRAPPPAPAR